MWNRRQFATLSALGFVGSASPASGGHFSQSTTSRSLPTGEVGFRRRVESAQSPTSELAVKLIGVSKAGIARACKDMLGNQMNERGGAWDALGEHSIDDWSAIM
jgi:hypothetical protein